MLPWRNNERSFRAFGRSSEQTCSEGLTLEISVRCLFTMKPFDQYQNFQINWTNPVKRKCLILRNTMTFTFFRKTSNVISEIVTWREIPSLFQGSPESAISSNQNCRILWHSSREEDELSAIRHVLEKALLWLIVTNIGSKHIRALIEVA